MPTGGRSGPSTSPTGSTHSSGSLTCRPIRLHDVRHGAATLALASHTDLKVIQQMLGHSSIVTTADTYTNSQELHLAGEKLQVAC
jgi:site-specific recombinase XerD